MELSVSEMVVLSALWNSDRPLTVAEISVCNGNKARRYFAQINSLLAKGAIKEIGRAKKGKTFARQFSPVISCEEYYMPIIDFLYKNGNLLECVKVLIKRTNDRAVLDTLATMIKSL